MKNSDVLIPWYDMPRRESFFPAITICNFVFSVREMAILFNIRKLAVYFKDSNGIVYARCPYCKEKLDEQSCSKEKCPNCNKNFYSSI